MMYLHDFRNKETSCNWTEKKEEYFTQVGLFPWESMDCIFTSRISVKSPTKDPECCCTCCDQHKVSWTHHPCPAVIALAPCHQTDWVQNRLSHISMCAYNHTPTSIETSFQIQSITFSSLLFPGARSFGNAAPTQMEQAARQVSPCKRHCFLSTAAEISFGFNFVIPSPTHPLPSSIPHVFLRLLWSPPPPYFFSSSLANATSMWFSCMEPDCALQVDVDIDIDGNWGTKASLSATVLIPSIYRCQLAHVVVVAVVIVVGLLLLLFIYVLFSILKI